MNRDPQMPPKIDFADESVTPDETLFQEEQKEPAFSRHVLTSPLHMSVARASRTNSWTSWNGVTSAEVLTSIDDEYLALRTRAAIADMSPLAKYRISGRDATAYLKRLMTDDVASLSIDRVMRVVFCEENGLVVGDGQLFRLDEMEYRLVTERSHLGWLADNQSSFRLKLEDVSASVASMRLAGPHAQSIFQAAGIEGIDTLKDNSAHWYRAGGAPAYVSRSNLPGSYDIWVDSEDASPLWSRLMGAGEPFGLLPIGRTVGEIARVEAGLLREGQDYIGAFYASERSVPLMPFDLGWDDRLDLAHGVFNGRASLRRQAGTSVATSFIQVEIEGDQSQSFKTVYLDKKAVGVLTSCVFSPLLNKHVGIARIKSVAAKSTNLQALPEARANLDAEPVWVAVRKMTPQTPSATEFGRSAV